MSADLLEHAVDKNQSAVREATVPGGRLGPDGKELGGEISAPGRVKIEMAGSEIAGKVPVLVDQPLGRISVGVDHEGGIMYLAGVGGEGHVDNLLAF